MTTDVRPLQAAPTRCGLGPADVLVRRRRVAAFPSERRQHAELRGEADQAEVVVAEEARVQHGMRDAGQGAEDAVCHPDPARQRRGMGGAGEPLAEADHRLDPRFARRVGARGIITIRLSSCPAVQRARSRDMYKKEGVTFGA
jgi:hypothetical protein